MLTGWVALRHGIAARVDDWRAGSTAPDGLPHPPRGLIRRITGTFPKRSFFASGKAYERELAALVARNGRSMADFPAVLDFGSGAGRVTRHLARPGGDLVGVDADADCVAWCRAALGAIASFHCNADRRPLPFPDGRFDFVLANSVFTHLDDADFDFWLAEIARVTAPRGWAMITLNGRVRADDVYPVKLSPTQRAAFDRGERVVVNAQRSGDNSFIGKDQCYTFVNAERAATLFAPWFATVEMVPGSRRHMQDMYLLERRST